VFVFHLLVQFGSNPSNSTTTHTCCLHLFIHQFSQTRCSLVS